MPGYSGGKTPEVLYVGRQAATHFDFGVYGDYDRDAAFVTVYNGVDSPFTGEGSLGSSWLYRYSGDTRTGYLTSITISVSDTDGDNRYDTSVSPYFDGEMYRVYSENTALQTGSIA